MSRIELPTSSLPRKCSTTELQQLSTSICSHCNQFSTPHSNDFLLNFLSGRRGSNPRPTAWKAVALPTELLPHFFDPRHSIFVTNIFFSNILWGEKDSNLRSSRNGFTVRPIWPLWNLPDTFEIEFTKTLNSLQNSMSHLPESNQRPTDYKSVALPAELKWRV